MLTFIIGTLPYTRDTDSHAWGERWSVNCVNSWVATLGHNLTLENAITHHLRIVIHELCHCASGLQKCWLPREWDDTIDRVIGELINA